MMNFRPSESQSKIDKDLGTGPGLPMGLVFLGVITFVLTAAQALLPLAPVPLALAVLLYGIRPGLSVFFTCMLSAFLLAQFFPALTSMLATLIFVAAIAFSVAIQLIKGEHPVMTLVRSGSGLFLAIMLLIGFTSLLSSDGIRGQVTQMIEAPIEKFLSHEENRNFLEQAEGRGAIIRDYIENPEKIVDQIMNWALGFTFVGVFFGVWLCLFFVLRNSLVWRLKLKYRYGLAQLMQFRLPEQVVWPLIIGLALYVGSGHVFPAGGAVIGGNILLALGVFYFFQGFGLYYETLVHFNVIGFLRSFLLVLTVLFAWEMLVFAGVFDVWVNFRKFLKKKMNKGDMS